MFKYPAHCGPKGDGTPVRGSHHYQHSKDCIVRLTSPLFSLRLVHLVGGGGKHHKET